MCGLPAFFFYCDLLLHIYLRTHICTLSAPRYRGHSPPLFFSLDANIEGFPFRV